MNNNIDEKFTRIYETYRDSVLEKSYKVIQNYQAAEDIMQETFLRLYNNLSEHKTDDQIKKILNITSHRLALKYERNFKRQKLNVKTENYLKAFIEEKQGELNPEIICLNADFEIRVVKRVLKLKEPYKSILISLEIGKVPSSELCKKYGISYNLLRVRVFRAKEIIRGKFCSELEEFYG